MLFAALLSGLLGIIPVPQCDGTNQALTWDGSKFACHVIGGFEGPPPPPQGNPPPPPPLGGCTGASAGSSATPDSGSGQFQNLSLADKAWSLPNSATICKVGLYSSAAASAQVFIVQANGGGSYTVLMSEAFTHPGGGWADKTLSQPYTVPASGTFYAAGNWGTATGVGLISSTFAFVSGIASGTQPWTEGNGNAMATRAFK